MASVSYSMSSSSTILVPPGSNGATVEPHVHIPHKMVSC